MFTLAHRNSTLGLNGLDVVRRDRIQNADPGGWFLCVAIPPRSGPFHTQSPAMSRDHLIPTWEAMTSMCQTCRDLIDAAVALSTVKLDPGADRVELMMYF